MRVLNSQDKSPALIAQVDTPVIRSTGSSTRSFTSLVRNRPYYNVTRRIRVNYVVFQVLLAQKTSFRRVASDSTLDTPQQAALTRPEPRKGRSTTRWTARRSRGTPPTLPPPRADDPLATDEPGTYLQIPKTTLREYIRRRPIHPSPKPGSCRDWTSTTIRGRYQQDSTEIACAPS